MAIHFVMTIGRQSGNSISHIAILLCVYFNFLKILFLKELLNIWLFLPPRKMVYWYPLKFVMTTQTNFSARPVYLFRSPLSFLKFNPATSRIILIRQYTDEYLSLRWSEDALTVWGRLFKSRLA